MSIMLFAGVFAGILARLASAAIRKSMTGAILKSLGSGAIVLSLMAGTVAAADQLSITLKVGQTPTGSDSYLYRQISAGGIISEDGISGSVPGMTVLAVAQATTVSLSTSGGYGSYGYVVTDGELPAGLSLSGATISGTPTTVQTYDFSITATDSYGNTGVRSYSGAVLRPVPTVTLAVSDASPSYGDLVTLTATLADGNAPSGTVTFKDGSTTLGSASLSGSTATYITSGLASGDHSITAVYGGDGNNERATSSSVSVTVAKAAPTVTLSASDAAATIGEPITFTANLSGGIAPTGTVTFMEGSNELSTASLSGSSATLTTADLAVGSHTLKAVYSGDGNNQSITSSEVDIIVAKATPTLAVTTSDSNPLIGSS
ncbi:MAG: Ig-like domain repeat protein, partial [Micrococcales bacterium]|nr:Ig-like domain repeat protein [Micrococcales bacterium]